MEARIICLAASQEDAKDAYASSTSLQGDKAALHEEVEALRVQYLQTRALLAESKVAKIEASTADASKNEVSEVRTNELEKALAGYKERERKLTARLTEAELTEGELSDTVEKLSDKISAMRIENQHVSQLMGAQRRDLERVLSDEVETEGVLTATQQRLREWQVRAQELETRFVDAARSHTKEEQQARDQWAEERKRLQAALAELRHENAVLASKALEGSERGERLDRALDSARSQVRVLTGALEKAESRAANAESEVSYLTTQVIQGRAAATALRAQVASLSDEVHTSQLQAELAGQRVGKSQLAARSAATAERKVYMELSDARSDIAELQTSLERAETRRAQAEARLAASGLLSEGAQETVDSAVAKSTKAQLAEQLARDQLAHELSLRQAAEAEVDTLLAQLRHVQEQLGQQRKQVKTYTQQVNDLRWAAVINNGQSGSAHSASSAHQPRSAAITGTMAHYASPRGNQSGTPSGTPAQPEDRAASAGFYSSTRIGAGPAALRKAIFGASGGTSAGDAQVRAYSAQLAGAVSPNGQHLPSATQQRSMGGYSLPVASPVASARTPFRSALGRAMAAGQLHGAAGSGGKPHYLSVQEVK